MKLGMISRSVLMLLGQYAITLQEWLEYFGLKLTKAVQKSDKIGVLHYITGDVLEVLA